MRITFEQFINIVKKAKEADKLFILDLNDVVKLYFGKNNVCFELKDFSFEVNKYTISCIDFYDDAIYFMANNRCHSLRCYQETKFK